MESKLQRKISNLESIERFPADDLFALLPIKDSDIVLDLGAGAGYVSLPISEHVKEVYAFDYDKDILQYLETKAREKGINNLSTVAGDFKDIPLENQIIDIAIASISLHEVQPLSEALKEINRVMKDKGFLLCVELEKTAAAKGPRVSSEDMEAAMVDAGFSVMDKIRPSATMANQPVYIIAAQKK